MNLFNHLCHHYTVHPDRRGEAHVDCPNCGKEAKRGQTHFSFSESGGHCFICDFSCSLNRLAQIAGLVDTDSDEWEPPVQYHHKKKPKRIYPWQSQTDELAEQYASAPGVVEAWQRYKPISEQMIKQHRLGLGTFPKYTSRCQHQRLMVPLIDFDGKIVGFRGRAIDCDCKAWLSPAGNQATLYNWQSVTPGCVLFIVENAIDALMVTERTEAVGVATLSISYWYDEWLNFLLEIQPSHIEVAYDNHRQGNGNGKAEWLAKHDKDIMPMGVKLTNRLREAGLPAYLFDWGNERLGMDMGELLKNA